MKRQTKKAMIEKVVARRQVKVERLADAFVATLVEWLTPFEFAEMRRRNETDSRYVNACASHDFCDANMAMHEAWRRAFGKDIDLGDSNSFSIWSQAWTLARRRVLGQYEETQQLTLTKENL